MSRALVVTVGTGTRADSDITRPLVLTIRDSRPERVIFLVTAESEANAERVRAECGLAEAHAPMERLADHEDVDRVYEQALRAFRALRDRGYRPDEIDADFTSGTKAMSAGLSLAAVDFGCNALKYVSGRRQHGVVVAGTERIFATRPAAALAHRQLGAAMRALELLQYRAARETCAQLPTAILDEHDRRLSDGLTVLAEAYDAWDKFRHGGFMGAYRRADMSLPELGRFRLAEGIVERVVAMDQALKRGQVSEDILADLFNNAERRGLEGRFDDQVARLYRAIEMLAQWVLERDHGVRTDDLSAEFLASLPEGIRSRLEQQRNPHNGRIAIGLQDSYLLLKELGSPLGAAFHHNNQLKSRLDYRNKSILAHGTRPVDKDRARAMDADARALAREALPDLDARCAALQFPWLEQA